jgi:DNA mismatch repair protein MutL
MSDIIRLLPDAIANQIAAGEVVQRPASAVKELLENSVDAGSTKIQLIVKEAGKVLMQVIDNGSGMSATDARMSFERHATSKIQTTEDLFHIKTMGFRGEALASIAAVAQVEMRTRTADKELGIVLQVEGSLLKKQEPVATPVGTSIAIKNLFYNVPARRNFLKSNPVELRHILDEFQRIALANPQVAFTFHQNDVETYALEASNLGQRIVGLFGKNYREQLIPCKEETPHLSIQGYIGKPEFARKTRGEQFFFINNRFVKNNYLNHAVSMGFEGMLAGDQFPFYVLFITIDPIHVDVNVHPTKTEVKFDDERTIYGTIKAAVKQSLGAFNVMPTLDFDTDVNFENYAKSNFQLTPGQATSKRDSQYGSFKTVDPRQDNNLHHWQSLFDKAKSEGTPDEHLVQLGDQRGMAAIPEAVIRESAANQLSTFDISDSQDQGNEPSQLHGMYLLKQVKRGLMVMQQQHVHERILFERYQLRMSVKKSTTQQSLFPTQLSLNPADFTLVNELEDEIRALGFSFEYFGKDAIVINGIPSDLVNVSEKQVFEGLIEQFKWNKKELSIDPSENMARALAKRTAIKVGQKLNPKEIGTLIDQLFDCDQPNYTPDGKPTFIILGLDKIESFFNK